MTDLARDFGAFFNQLWGMAPFDWQVALAEQVVTTGRWPALLDLPTGSGKTAALDIAVYALAARCETMPRRVAFVVDRRTIVDQTAARARAVADRLQSALTGDPASPLTRVAQRLAGLSGTGVALDIGRLRGGGPRLLDPQEWLRWPDQPAVIVSTVDQFGSRLLFRGYGVGRRMAPIHAGLTGADTLILLDEVQLSTALVETLEALEQLPAEIRVTRPNQVVRMSATPGTGPLQRFPAEPSLLTGDARLAGRIGARKRCRLLPAIGKKGQDPAAAWGSAIKVLAERPEITDGVIGVVVNRVATAVAVHRRLVELGHGSLLITGRMRGRERTRAQAQATAWAAADRETQPGLRFVVATQCIEVGADYSFDALISEICPLAALRQRLGRLDRRGVHAAAGLPAQAFIVATTGQPADDPIYGPALGATLAELEKRFGHEEFDCGPMSQDLTELGTGLDMPPVPAAVLMPTDLDELAATTTDRPLEATVDALLHGFRKPNADVSLVWRFDLPPLTDDGIDAASSILGALSALPSERLDVPVTAVRQWLAAPNAVPPATADIDSPGIEVSPASGVSVNRRVWRLDDEGAAQPIDAHELRPGDVVFAPAEYGGLVDGVWDPSGTEPVSDIADEVTYEAGWVVLRPRDDDPWRRPDSDDDSETGSRRAEFVAEANRRSRLPGPTASASAAGSRQDAGSHEDHDSRPGCMARLADVVDYGDRWAVICPARRIPDGRDATNSHLGVQVSLTDHLQGVAAMAREMAERCGLPDELVADLGLAGELHDLGKADERFQFGLVGDVLELASRDELLAKSGRPGGHVRCGDPFWDYPPGTRHEFLSAALACQDPGLLQEAHDPDLVLHLIVTHHGQARPWPELVADPAPREVAVSVRGRRLVTNTQLTGDFGAQQAMRFYRLLRRYGHHGLAWLEAVFRLADHRRSEAETRDPEVTT